MAGNCHEEQHWKCQDKIRPRNELSQKAERRRISRHRCSPGCGFSPADKLLLDSPNDSPDVQHHEPAESPSDTDGQKKVALPSVSVKREVKPCRAGDYQCNDQAKYWPFLQGFQRRL